jgi:hypothetical protein
MLLGCLVCSLALVLLARLQKASSTVWRLKPSAGNATPFEIAIGRFLAEAIDGSMLDQSGSRGLAEVDVRFKEAHDRFGNVKQLVQTILDSAEDNKTQNLVQLIKYLYQLQYSLGVTIANVHECLNVIIGRLIGQSGTQIKLVQEGELVDMTMMFPLNSGSRVRQPLGIVIYDPDGRVVNKAKVLCY